MAAVELGVDLSALTNALIHGDKAAIIAAARAHLEHGDAPDVLIGRIGTLAAQGDTEGHLVITLGAAAMLARYLRWLPEPIEADTTAKTRALPLFVNALLAAAPAVKAGQNLQYQSPSPFFPSGLEEGKTVNDMMHDAIYNNDATLAERLMLGLYGTGADYRTLQVRAYDSISTTFHDAGHPLLCASRGFQILDAVEWGDYTPTIVHWLAPFRPLHPQSNEPEWIQALRDYTSNPAHDVSSIRTRIAAPRDEAALPLHELILSDADTTSVCQGVYDALMKNGASRQAISSVIALAAAEILQQVGDTDREVFVRVSHGLLYASAVRLVFRQVQDVEVLSLLFTAAAFVNALHKEISSQDTGKPEHVPAPARIVGGGLVASTQLETLGKQIIGGDYADALTTARRYLTIGHDARALFGAIGLAAAQNSISADQGHGLQIIQAASEEYLSWPRSLTSTNIEILLQIAIRAATFGQRDPEIAALA